MFNWVFGIFFLISVTYQEPLSYLKDFSKINVEVKNWVYTENNKLFIHERNTQDNIEKLNIYTHAFDQISSLPSNKLNLANKEPLYFLYSEKSSKTYMIAFELSKQENYAKELTIQEISEDSKVENKLVQKFYFYKVTIVPQKGFIYVYGISKDSSGFKQSKDFFFDDNFNMKEPFVNDQLNINRDVVAASLDLRDYRLSVVFQYFEKDPIYVQSWKQGWLEIRPRRKHPIEKERILVRPEDYSRTRLKIEVLSDREEKQFITIWTNENKLSILTLHLNDLNSQYYDLDTHLFPIQVRAEYLRRSSSNENLLYVLVQDHQIGNKYELILFEASYKMQNGNVKHGRTTLIEKYRNKIQQNIDLEIKTLYGGYNLFITDSSMIMSISKQKILFQTTLKIPELSKPYANCGGNCAVCESQIYGCKFCLQGPRKQFQLGMNKFYMGCKGDPAIPINQCPTYFDKISCLIKKKNGFDFNLRLSTQQTLLDKKAVFEITFSDQKLESYLSKDYLVKKLAIKPQSALCSNKQYYSIVKIIKNSVQIVYHPNKECKLLLHKHNVNQFILYKTEANNDPRMMSNFKLSPSSSMIINLNAKELQYLFNTIMTKKELQNQILAEQKKLKFLNTTIDKKNVSYKYKKVEEASFIARMVALFTAPVMGFKYAVVAMTLSLIIQLFHTFALFSTNFGPYLQYFFLATTKVLDDGEKSHKLKFMPKNMNKKLVNDGELNIITIHQYRIEFLMIGTFFLFRMLRYMMREWLFVKWERKHGLMVFFPLNPDEFGEDKQLSTKSQSLEKNKTKKSTKEFNLSNITSLNGSFNQEMKPINKIKHPLTLWRKLLLRIFRTTYLLEFVIFCRLLSGFLLHSSYNLVEFTFKVNKLNWTFIANLILSFLGLQILIYEIVRFIRINIKFVRYQAKNDPQYLKSKSNSDQSSLDLNTSASSRGIELSKSTITLSNSSKKTYLRNIESNLDETINQNLLTENDIEDDEALADLDNDSSSENDNSNSYLEGKSENDELDEILENGILVTQEGEFLTNKNKEDSLVLKDNRENKKKDQIESVVSNSNKKLPELDYSQLNQDKIKDIKVKSISNSNQSQVSLNKSLKSQTKSQKSVKLQTNASPKKRSEIELLEDPNINDNYYWRNFRFKEAEKFFKDNFEYLPKRSLVKYLNLWCASRLVIYEILIVGLQNLALLQILIPSILEIFVTVIIIRGHTVYKCYESNWAFGRYMFQQTSILMLLFLGFININYFKGDFGIGNVNKTAMQSRLINPVVETFLECTTIIIVMITVLFEAIEIIKKYVEDMIAAYQRNKAQGKKWWQMFFSNEGDTVLLENLLG